MTLWHIGLYIQCSMIEVNPEEVRQDKLTFQMHHVTSSYTKAVLKLGALFTSIRSQQNLMRIPKVHVILSYLLWGKSVTNLTLVTGLAL